MPTNDCIQVYGNSSVIINGNTFHNDKIHIRNGEVNLNEHKNYCDGKHMDQRHNNIIIQCTPQQNDPNGPIIINGNGNGNGHENGHGNDVNKPIQIGNIS